VIRFHFVSNNQAELPVKRMCELVEVPRSSFYAWLNRTPSARERADAELLDVIEDIYRRSRNTYGVTPDLRPAAPVRASDRTITGGSVDARERPGRSAFTQEVEAWPARRWWSAGSVESGLHRHCSESAVGG
jgi:hypothetical protein